MYETGRLFTCLLLKESVVSCSCVWWILPAFSSVDAILMFGQVPCLEVRDSMMVM